VLFHEGDLADSLHLIARGRVTVGVTTRYGNLVTFSLLGAGDFFGELALLSEDSRRTATVTALEPTETLAVDRLAFQRLRAEQPQVGELLLHLLADRVRALSDLLAEAYYVPAEVRVLRRLLGIAGSYPWSGPIPLTQEQLGGIAGAARGTVNRVLRREAAKGNLRLERGRITVLDPEALKSRAGLPP
jgi:CRP-like cAMP-binding protein